MAFRKEKQAVSGFNSITISLASPELHDQKRGFSHRIYRP